MFKKSFYLATMASFYSISIFCTAINKVEVRVQLQVGDKVDESVITVDSESYTQLSMRNENLGFALKLTDATEGDERINTVPTNNKKPIVNFIHTGKVAKFGAGCNMNGYKFEKDLVITFLTIKKIS